MNAAGGSRIFVEHPRGDCPIICRNLDQLPRGGIILKTVAPAAAILLMRKPEDYYDEGEVVIDPFEIGRVYSVDRPRQKLYVNVHTEANKGGEIRGQVTK